MRRRSPSALGAVPVLVFTCFTLTVMAGCEPDDPCSGHISVVIHNETMEDLAFSIIVDRSGCNISSTIQTDLGAAGQGVGNYDLRAGDELTISDGGLCVTCDVTADGEANEYVTISFFAGSINCGDGLSPAAPCP